MNKKLVSNFNLLSPCDATFFIHVDGSYRKDSSSAGWAFTVFSSNGILISVEYESSIRASCQELEVEVLGRVVKYIQAAGLPNGILFSDCLALVNDINDGDDYLVGLVKTKSNHLSN